MTHELSVVVVSDFEAASTKSWSDELKMVAALAVQDIGQDFNLIIVEDSAHENEPIPEELFTIFPGVRIVFHPAQNSSQLKDYGVSLVDSEWVAVLEADSIPEPDWLSRVLKIAKANTQFDAVSGLTYYGNESSYQRVLNLLDRSFNDSGRSKECAFISNNGALYRRSVIARFPYPETISPFYSARLRNRQMRDSGHRFYFERQARMTHQLGGLAFIHDAHTNLGYMYMKVSGKNRFSDITGLALKYLWSDLKRYYWLGSLYLKWYDLPLALLLILVVRIPEIRGMYLALRDVDALPGTAYR